MPDLLACFCDSVDSSVGCVKRFKEGDASFEWLVFGIILQVYNASVRNVGLHRISGNYLCGNNIRG